MSDDQSSAPSWAPYTFTSTAAILLFLHIFWPTLGVDWVAIVLLVIGALPWAYPVFRYFREFALKVSGIELTARLKDLNLLTSNVEGFADPPTALSIAETDPRTAIIELRSSLSRKLVALAEVSSLNAEGLPAIRTLGLLRRHGAIEPEIATLVHDTIALIDDSLSGQSIDPRALQWLNAQGPRLVGRIESATVAKTVAMLDPTSFARSVRAPESATAMHEGDVSQAPDESVAATSIPASPTDVGYLELYAHFEDEFGSANQCMIDITQVIDGFSATATTGTTRLKSLAPIDSAKKRRKAREAVDDYASALESLSDTLDEKVDLLRGHYESGLSAMGGMLQMLSTEFGEGRQEEIRVATEQLRSASKSTAASISSMKDLMRAISTVPPISSRANAGKRRATSAIGKLVSALSSIETELLATVQTAGEALSRAGDRTEDRAQ